MRAHLSLPLLALLLLCLVLACTPCASAAATADLPELSLSYYEVLEVPLNVEGAALKKAYRAAALKWHPDRFVDRPAELLEANARFVLIAEANDVLADEHKRKDYDMLLEHGHLRFDPRMVAEIRNEQNMAWAGKAGFTFSRRRGSDGEELDDTWMLAIAAAFTVLSITVPAVQWFRRRSRAAAKKKESAAEFKRSLAATQQRGMDERSAADSLRAEKLAADRAASAAAQAERSADGGGEDEDEEGKNASGLTAEQQAEREERRAAKAAFKKNKIAFRTLVKPITVAAAASLVDNQAAVPAAASAGKKSGKGGQSSGTASSQLPLRAEEVDPLLSLTTPSELAELLTALTPILDTAAAAGALTPPSTKQLQQASALLAPTLTRLRANQAEEASREAHKAAERQRRADEAASGEGGSASSSAGASSGPVEWSAAELSMLAKGTAKYPGGTSGRWDKITELVGSVGPGRSVKEVLARSRAQELLAPLRRTHQHNEQAQAFEAFQDKLAHRIHASTSTSSSSSSSNLGQSAAGLAAAAAHATATATPVAAPSAAAATPSATAAVASSSASATPAAAAAVEEEDEWSAVQQSALELALRTVGKDVADRWDVIAAAVPGKSKKQVLARFKLIKAKLQAAAAAGAK